MSHRLAPLSDSRSQVAATTSHTLNHAGLLLPRYIRPLLRAVVSSRLPLARFAAPAIRYSLTEGVKSVTLHLMFGSQASRPSGKFSAIHARRGTNIVVAFDRPRLVRLHDCGDLMGLGRRDERDCLGLGTTAALIARSHNRNSQQTVIPRDRPGTGTTGTTARRMAPKLVPANTPTILHLIEN